MNLRKVVAGNQVGKPDAVMPRCGAYLEALTINCDQTSDDVDKRCTGGEKPQQVIRSNGNLYCEWRLRTQGTNALQEADGTPAEHVLQVIWFHQRLLRDRLCTTDGVPIIVLHPGLWSHEGGPDFRGAIIQFGSERPVSGDIEIDLHPNGWRAHRHDKNPAFKQVLLHVVWEGEAKGELPTLRLRHVLDAPLEELLTWSGTDLGRSFPSELRGKCCAPLRDLEKQRLLELLRQAARVRLHTKAAQLRARAQQSGWEQALWEALFRGLGYKHNVWPMLRLAELRERLAPERGELGCLELQARLLGTANLLPSEVTGNSFARRLWDIWWRERNTFEECCIPRATWRLHALRPANHPQRRLAVAAHWLAINRLIPAIERWSVEPNASGCEQRLLTILQPGRDNVWNWHWTLRSRRLSKSQPLLGTARVTDLAVNVILPWLWIRAVDGKNEAMREEIERRYFAWPAGEDNAVLRLACQRLFGTASSRMLRSASTQQGLIQIVRDFCDHSDALCTNCQFPDLVLAFK